MFRFFSHIFGFTPYVNNGSLKKAGHADRRMPRSTFQPRLEELEPRMLLSNDFYWHPSSGNNIDAIQYINGYPYLVNWDVGSLGSGMHPTSLPSGTGVTLIFDGGSNANCNVDTNLSGSIVLQNGYTATITISDSTTLTEYGYTDNDIPADFFNVAFAGPGAVQNFSTGEAVMGNFAWGAGATTAINGASVVIGSKANLNQSTASPVMINDGSLALGPANANSGSSTFKLTNNLANINVEPNAGLAFYMPTNAATLVDNTGTTAQISNKGLTTLYNTPGGGFADINVPFENHATIDASNGGDWYFNTADAKNNDLYMDAGKISLKGGVSLNCAHGYTQDGGTLEIADSQSEMLLVKGAGATNFNGGKIVFDSTSGYGTLDVNNVIFNGVEIDMRIAGNGNSSDRIACLLGNTCTLQGSTNLVVTATNPVVKGTKFNWTLIVPSAGKTITNNLANFTLPPNVIQNNLKTPNSWQCSPAPS